VEVTCFLLLRAFVAAGEKKIIQLKPILSNQSHNVKASWSIQIGRKEKEGKNLPHCQGK
jgi:hypothetical protein